MARKREKLLISTFARDQENRITEEDTYYSKSGAVERFFTTPNGRPQEHQYYTKRVHFSDSEMVYNELKAAISRNDASALNKILTANFIYEFNNSYATGNFRSRLNTYLICTVRPNIEALLVNDLGKVIGLIDLLIQANKSDLYSAFFSSLENTALQDNNLFRWNDSIKSNLQIHLAELYAYGEQKEYGINEIERQKGLAAMEFTLKYHDPVKSWPIEEQDNNLSAHKKLENLRFKLNMVNELTKLDKQFSKDNIKCIVVNLFTILFSAGFANLICYIANRIHDQNSASFLFFNRTTSQKLADEVHVALGFNPPSALIK